MASGFPVGDMDGPLLLLSLEERMELWKLGNSRTMMCMGGIGHALSICLDSCGTFGLASLMSCISPCVFCCI